MGQKFKVGAGSFKVDAGIYVAKIIGMEAKEGTNGQYLVWSLKLKDPVLDDEPIENPNFTLGAITSFATGKDSNLFKMAKAALGNLEVGDEFDSDDLIGKVVKVVVKDNEKNESFSKVTDYLPYKSNKKKIEKKVEPEKKVNKKTTIKPKEEDFEEDLELDATEKLIEELDDLKDDFED